jgi:lycopene beta-cyclase
VVPVHDGWLVEETVLAARPAVDPSMLRARLEHRLGPDGRELVDAALRSESVRIPMGGPIPAPSQAVVRFGAAAGFVHPATGYSVAASIRAAPRVAAAIAEGDDVWRAVWPRAHRRARALHDYGLERILRLDADDTRAFFDAFFDLPADRWGEYLRVDTTPAAVASVMRGVFSGSPPTVRRRLMAGNPRALVRLLQR